MFPTAIPIKLCACVTSAGLTWHISVAAYRVQLWVRPLIFFPPHSLQTLWNLARKEEALWSFPDEFLCPETKTCVTFNYSILPSSSGGQARAMTIACAGLEISRASLIYSLQGMSHVCWWGCLLGTVSSTYAVYYHSSSLSKKYFY